MQAQRGSELRFRLQPEVGSWYRRLDRPQAFQVVAFDAEARTVDIEYFDGTVDEWPLSHWFGLEIEPCGAPQDWSGPFDDVEPADLDSAAFGESPSGPLEGIDAEAHKGAPPRARPRRRHRSSRAHRT